MNVLSILCVLCLTALSGIPAAFAQEWMLLSRAGRAASVCNC